MSRGRVVRRVALGIAALVVVLLVVGIVLLVNTVRRPFPTTEGERSLPGLTASATVRRDDQGVPRIYADNPQDLFRAQGYVAAQDRFFEMDLRRHITAGRLSELVGEAGVDTDKVIRTMGWRRVAEQELPLLSSATRSYLQAYADGVNAYVRQAGSPADLALEYAVLAIRYPDYTIEDWTPLDSLTRLKAIAWDLRGDYTDELLRARLAGSIAPRRIAQLFPAYPYQQRAPILSDQAWSPADATAGAGQETAASALPSYLTDRQAGAAYGAAVTAMGNVAATLGTGSDIGSNSWVLSGAKSSTGKPLLANDPHLELSIPGIWYQTGLHCRTVSAACPFDVSGFSFAGMPGVVVGHNANIAWGTTNLGPDVTDFYLEQVIGRQYLRDGRLRPLVTRSETIKVAGGKDVGILVRSTVHGPLLSDVAPGVRAAGQSAPVPGGTENTGYAVSLAWTGLVPGKTADALFAIDRATSFADFRAAARSFAVPSQNLVYADTQGHIGYQAPGLIPVRASADPTAPPGYWPAPGWDSRYDWKSYVPFDQMPYSYDPPEGFLVTANQAVTASSEPFLTTQWDFGFRSQRIRDLIEATPTVTPQRMAEIQLDVRNEFAPTLVKHLLAVDLSGDSFTEGAQQLLDGWDYTQPVGQSKSAAAAAYFNAVWKRLLALTFDDELPAGMEADGSDQWMQALAGLLATPRDAWWDNRQTANITEDMTEALRQSLVDARLELTKALGKNSGIWQWGRLHSATMTHPVMGAEANPSYIQRLFNRGPVQLPGGSAIVNANGWNAAEGFAATRGPSMRMVVDLGNLDASRWVNQTGNSGHAFAEHYDDQLDAWATGQTYPWPSTEEAVKDAGGDVLTLVPAGPSE